MESITIQEAADRLNVSRQTIYNHIKKFDNDQKKRFLIINGKKKLISLRGYNYLEQKLKPLNYIDNELLTEKDKNIAHLEGELERYKELNETLQKEYSLTINNLIDKHHQQTNQLNTIIQNQQILTLQLENNKKPFFKRFKRKKFKE